MSALEIIFTILAVLSLLFLVAVVVDKTIFDRRLKDAKKGMTGKEVQKNTGFKMKVIQIEGNQYTAEVRSFITLFKCKLIFVNGRLIIKQK